MRLYKIDREKEWKKWEDFLKVQQKILEHTMNTWDLIEKKRIGHMVNNIRPEASDGE